MVEFYKYRKENNLENEFEEKEIEKRINPKVYMEDGKTIISIAFPYYHEDVNEIIMDFLYILKEEIIIE